MAVLDLKKLLAPVKKQKPGKPEKPARQRLPQEPSWHPFTVPPEGFLFFTDLVREIFGTAYVPVDLLVLTIRAFLADHGQLTAGVGAATDPGTIFVVAGGPSYEQASNRLKIARLLPKLGQSETEGAEDSRYLVWAAIVDHARPMLVPVEHADEIRQGLVRAGRFSGLGLSSAGRDWLDRL